MPFTYFFRKIWIVKGRVNFFYKEKIISTSLVFPKIDAYYISSSLIDVRDERNSKIHKEIPNTKFRVRPRELPWLTENDGIVPIRLELKERIILPMKWNSMDKEPLMCGVILYSKRENKINDGSYIGDGHFFVNNLTVDKSNFDCWIQREIFFKESGLSKFLDDAATASDTIQTQKIYKENDR